MTTTTTKKNTPAKVAKKDKPAKIKKEKVAKVDFLKSCESTLINENGKLNSVPAIGEGGWVNGTHAPLKKAAFANEADYLDFSAAIDEIHAEALTKKAAAKRAQAETSRKFGDPKQKAAAKRLVKMMSAMEELKKQLGEQGVNVEDLIGV
jgi:hypothetical protein